MRRLCMVTLSTPEVECYASITRRGKVEYCSRWSYGFVSLPYSLATERPPAWSKILLLKKLLGVADWLWWTDADTAIHDMGVEAAALVDDAFDVVMAKDPNGLNSGSFMLKSSEWSAWFLDEVWKMGPQEKPGFWEQDAVWKLYEDPAVAARFKIAEKRVLNCGLDGGASGPGALLVHGARMSAQRRMKYFRGHRPIGPILEVLRAFYGVDSTFLDVSAKVRTMVVAGRLGLKSDFGGYNRMFGDPAPGKTKTLRVVFSRLGGPVDEAEVEESEDLVL